MGSLFFISMSIALLLFLPLFQILVTSSSSFNRPPLCHDAESYALLKVKESFIIDMQASSDPFSYPKVNSWKLEGEQSDCCFWDGVECDNITGHVIGLDLSSSCLYGSINSNSSLFQFLHLHSLNLADNDFNHSPIPSTLANLFKLTYLNLSSSVFSGQIPNSISRLSKLSSLDLSLNRELILKNPNFGGLVRNLSYLEDLNLGSVDVSSPVPDVFANLSFLHSLVLDDCRLYGEFPSGVFQLPKLQILDLSSNKDLHGHLPEFNMTSPLQSLELAHAQFFGQIPVSIGRLGSLKALDVWDCNFFGEIPAASLGNLTQLVDLDLSDNKFENQTFSSWSWIGQRAKFLYLALSGISFNGEIPSYFANLTQLTGLYLNRCQITGHIPSWFMMMSRLVYLDLAVNELKGSIPSLISRCIQLIILDLSWNELQGPIPGSIFKLKNLEYVHLGFNNLNGTVEFDEFLKLRKLTTLALSANKLSLRFQVNANVTSQKFVHLALGSCNLSQFPDFLRDQDELQWLDLVGNNIHGQIPKWIWNTSRDSLELVDLSYNFLTGFELHPAVIQWSRVNILDIRSNMLQGPLPIPPPATTHYLVSNNNLTGQVSPLICTLNSLHVLDLSDNNLSGKLPQCLEKFSASLELLNLARNKFQGKIPQPGSKDCNLEMLTLDNNQFEGKVPESLAICARLEFLVVGNNQINDVFPYWLGALQELKVLILRSNQFHGVLADDDHVTNYGFPKLHIIDLSQNNFSGQLTQRFLNWKAMQIAEIDVLAYMEAGMNITVEGSPAYSNYSYSMMINNKGTDREYRRILEFFIAIDLSSNRFEGKIPDFFGNLRGLRSLNLADNLLTGYIPSSLGNLSKLEALDLSQNKLSGEIPQELTNLTFLSFFNLSHNDLMGSIPQGKQFNTFDNSSYEGNSRLCGSPLSKKCETSPSPSHSSSEEDQESGSPFEFGWKPVAIGYATGFITGAVIGHIAFIRKREWFLKIFGTTQQKMRRIRVSTGRHRN